MKKCCFLLLLLLSKGVFAQRYCDLEVTGGVTGTNINIDPSGASPTYFDFYLLNNGADTLRETDTVCFFSDFLTGGGGAFISPVILAPGGSINIKDTFYFKSGPAEGNYELCDSVWATSIASDLAIDTVPSNNRKCRLLKVVYIEPSAIAEVPAAGEEEEKAILGIHPNPASGLIAFDFIARNGSAVQAEVYDISGRLVLQQKYGPSYKGQSGYQLDVSTLQRGMYFIVLKQEGVQLSGKVFRQ